MDLLLGTGLGFQVLDPVQTRDLVGRQGQHSWHRGRLSPPGPWREAPLHQWGAHQRLGLTPARTSHLRRAESSFSPSESSRLFMNNHSQIFLSINSELSKMPLRTVPCSRHLSNTDLCRETLCKSKERWQTFSRAKFSPTLSTQIFKLQLFCHFSGLWLLYVIRQVIINQKGWKGWAGEY